MEQVETLCDQVQTAKELTYLGDRLSADESCEAANSRMRQNTIWVG